jgi:Domain of unknown function (DUF5753)
VRTSGFRLYDDLVIVESIVGEQQLAEADDVARYEKYLELLRDAASTGTEAAAVIRRSLESLRSSAARACDGRSLDANGERTVAHKLD